MTSEMAFILPNDIPLDIYPKPEVFIHEAQRLTEEAQKQGLVLRVMGAFAVRNYFPDFIDLYNSMKRLGDRVFTDIDYAAYGKHRSKLVSLFHSQGYEIDKDTVMYFGQERHIYFSNNYLERVPMIDVFFDKLDMNHCINYAGRLELDPYSVSMTDLLLQKLQIVHMNDKDFKDAILLLLAAPLGEGEERTISLPYLAKRMADDWGFYYTSTQNLEKIKAYLVKVPAINEEQAGIVSAKVEKICQHLENEKKSFKWKLRARTGPKKMWYKEVSDWA
jgi:hypothetical protein